MASARTRAPAEGTTSGASGNVRSPAMPSGSRLDARMRKPGPAASMALANSAHACVRCSQLSSTSRSRRSAANFASASMTGRPGSSLTPSTDAADCATIRGSPTGASSMNQAPSGKSPSTWAATCSDSRVLPKPPPPMSVSSRVSRSSWHTAATSCCRPMKDVSCCGRLLGVASSERNAGNASRNCGCTTWNTRSARERSRSRTLPRSRSVVSDGRRSWASVATAADSSTWPPCATLMIRAARLTALPKKSSSRL